jgi:hypothetical protein
MSRATTGVRRASGLRFLLVASVLLLVLAEGALVALAPPEARTALEMDRGAPAVPASTVAQRGLDGLVTDRGPAPRHVARLPLFSSPRVQGLASPSAPALPAGDAGRALARAGRLSAPTTAPPSLS